MKKIFVLLITATFLTTITGSAFAQWANPDLLITPEILKKNLSDPGWVVIDCRSKKKYITQIVKTRIATTEEMLQIAKGTKKDIQVIDARPKFEHNGKKKYAIKGGHIPHTTINIHYKMMFNIKSGKLKPPPKMEEILKSLDTNKRTVAYCQIGSRSALTYLVLRLMGFKDPANYDESWIVWGNNMKYPAVSEY